MKLGQEQKCPETVHSELTPALEVDAQANVTVLKYNQSYWHIKKHITRVPGWLKYNVFITLNSTGLLLVHRKVIGFYILMFLSYDLAIIAY